MIMNYLDVKEWFVKDVKELKLNDQIWIDYKANNEVSSGEALKEDKIVWVFKSVTFVYFPLHHPRVSM